MYCIIGMYRKQHLACDIKTVREIVSIKKKPCWVVSLSQFSLKCISWAVCCQTLVSFLTETDFEALSGIVLRKILWLKILCHSFTLSMHPQPTSEELKLFGTEFHLATLLQSAIQMRDTEGICNPAWEWHGYRKNVYIRPCLSQWRIQRGFHGFHGTPLFEGLLSKILSANVLCTLYVQTGAAHLSFTVAIKHMYQEFDAREAYVHVYIETISEANERMKAKVCIAPSAAIGMVICYLHESTYFPRLMWITSCFAASSPLNSSASQLNK